MPSLSLEISGADAPQHNVVLPEGTTVLGRAPTSNILLDHPMVSRRHAEIRRTATGAEIADMGSANGTLLNDLELPIKEWRPVRPGDQIEVGPFSLKLKGDAASADTALIQHGTVLVSAVAPQRLIVRIAGDQTAELTLTAPSYTLGRSPDNDIVINDPAISRQHARLDKRGKTYAITDLDSTNGLTFGGNLVQTRELSQGDRLQIGQSVELEFRTELAGEARSSPAIDLRSNQEVVLGRGGGRAGVAEVLNPQVSRVHARIVNENGRLVIEDAGSEGGTFVNGERVQRQAINEGDEIRLGGQALRLVNGQLQAQTDADLTLETVNLRRVVGNGTTILQDVNLSIRSREFVAIVGPSGAGKSTLITAMCGYVQATSGQVLINGNDFYAQLEAYRNDIGYVPQDDIIHRELNINRAFAYAAKLRMPEDTRPYEREERCNEVLEELGLTQHAQTAVRQLSGGQRKRVSIGVELLTGPSLLFLDEATTGLDPGIETQMMKLFRQLADNGRIVVLVTHATKNVMICDKVAFMAKGGYLAFFGPPEEALTYFDTKDFDEIYLRLEEKSGEEWGRLFEMHTRRQGGGRPARAARTRRAATMSMRETKPSRNPFKQFVTLTSRSLETLMRSPKDIATLLALAPFLGSLNFLIWERQTFSVTEGDSNDALTMFFMLTIVTLLVGSLGSVREIVKEAAIYKREHMVCIQVVPYIASKVFIGMLFAFYSAAMLFFFQIVAVDFSYLDVSGFAELFVPVFLATFSGVMIGLLVSAISPSEERAMLLIIAVIIPQFLLSGAMVPINDMGGAGPVLTTPATAKWAWGSMLTTTQAKTGVCDTGSVDPPREPDIAGCRVPGINGPDIQTDADKVSLVRSLERYGNVFNVNVVEYWGAMGGIILVVLGMVVVVQKRKDAD